MVKETKKQPRKIVTEFLLRAEKGIKPLEQLEETLNLYYDLLEKKLKKQISAEENNIMKYKQELEGLEEECKLWEREHDHKIEEELLSIQLLNTDLEDVKGSVSSKLPRLSNIRSKYTIKLKELEVNQQSIKGLIEEAEYNVKVLKQYIKKIQ